MRGEGIYAEVDWEKKRKEQLLARQKGSGSPSERTWHWQLGGQDPPAPGKLRRSPLRSDIAQSHVFPVPFRQDLPDSLSSQTDCLFGHSGTSHMIVIFDPPNRNLLHVAPLRLPDPGLSQAASIAIFDPFIALSGRASVLRNR